jgi:phosphoadenosine phosphosulfate reductase
MNIDSLDIEILNQNFETRTPMDILNWSWQTFGLQAVSSSAFQPQSIALLHMISQVCPELPIIFTDTGYHFPETLSYRDEIARKLNLNVQTVYADPESKKHLQNSSEPLYLRDPDLCCRIHKVEPMARALLNKKAWITGVRREQTAQRSKIAIVEIRSDGLFKISPLANWTKRDVWTYINRYDLPIHPLFFQGYASIGCAPCTRPVFAEQDERAGRWAGTDKTECGLHTVVVPLNEIQNNEPGQG